MPSLNLKTKQLRYAKADENALDAAILLLATMREYDPVAADDAKDAGDVLARLYEHVHRARNGGPKTAAKTA